jgi:hypothetical protein
MARVHDMPPSISGYTDHAIQRHIADSSVVGNWTASLAAMPGPPKGAITHLCVV